MKLDKLYDTSLYLDFKGVYATSKLLPEINVKGKDAEYYIATPVQTYGTFIYAGFDSIARDTNTACLMTVVFAPKQYSGIIPSQITKSVNRPDIFGTDDVNAYITRSAYLICDTVLLTLYPTISSTGSNYNLLVDSLTISSKEATQNYYPPIFVDINLTQDPSNGNDFTHIFPITTYANKVNFVHDYNTLTGQLITRPPYMDGYIPLSYSLASAGQQEGLNVFLDNLSNVDELVPYLPYRFPSFVYDVTLDLNTGLCTLKWNTFYPNNLIKGSKIRASLRGRNGEVVKNVSITVNDNTTGEYSFPIDYLILDNNLYTSVSLQSYYGEKYVGETIFVVSNPYEKSEEYAGFTKPDDVNVEEEYESHLTVTYIP